MNQILATGNNNDNNKRSKEIKEEDYNPISEGYDFNSLNSYEEKNYNNKTSSNNTKKIIIIFAICIAILGLALIGVFGYSKLKNNKKQDKKVTSAPVIAIEEEGNNAKITVKAEGTSFKVTYYWDDEENAVKTETANNKYENLLEIPNGNTTLYVKVENENGQTSESNKSFVRDYDVREPKISDPEQYGIGQLKIVATDETAMDSIKYKWEDDEEEQEEKVKNEGDKEIEVIIDANRGNKKLYITATDTSGNEATKTANIQGALNPTIEVKKTKSGKLKIKVSHDKGFKKVEIYVNGEITTYDEESEDYDKELTLIEKTYNMQEGENVVAIVATSLEWDEEHKEYTHKEFYSSTEYNP